MEIYRDLSRPTARTEPDTSAAKIGENKENIEHHRLTEQNHNSRRTMSMPGRPRGLRERRIESLSPQQGEPNSMGEKGDPVEVSQRMVLEDVTHRYNSTSHEESDEESMMYISSRETELQQSAVPPQRQTGLFSSYQYGRGSPRFTRNMR